MKQVRSIVWGALLFWVVLGAAAIAFGQGDAKTRLDVSYDVSLQVLVGSNDGGQRSDLPANLANVSRDLKTNFAFSNYRLVSTLMGRVADAGSFEYKSVSNLTGQESTGASPTFMDWSIRDLRGITNDKGRPGFQAQSFNLGARIPVVTSSFKSEGGKENNVIAYESIGINLNRLGLADGVPTLVGNLSLPGTSGTMFLVITVKPSE